MRRQILFLLLLVAVSTTSLAQVDGDYRTDQTGIWTAPTTWQVFVSGAWQNVETAGAGVFQNITPTSASGAILIQNAVTVTSSVTANQVTHSAGNITINASQTLTITDDGSAAIDFIHTAGGFVVTGALVFDTNTTYEHRRNGGTIPLATWNTGSTCYITGITTTNPTINSASAFYNFTWECASQAGNRSFNSNVRIVNGDLLISNTNNQLVNFGSGTAFTLDVQGDLEVTGNSIIRFCTTANPVVINVEGGFDYSSSAAGTSSLKTSGTYTLNVANDFVQNSGTINLAAGANVSTINVEGDFVQNGGTLTESSTGSIEFGFTGTGGQQSFIQSGTIANAIDFAVSNTAGLILNTNATLPRNFDQLGGSGNVDLNGNVLTINGSLSQASGSLAVNSASQLILQGTGVLPGVGFPISFSGSDLARLQLNQTGTFETSSSITIANLDLFNGALSTSSISIADGGTIERRLGSISNAPGGSNYNLVYNITVATNTGPEMPASATVLNNLTKQTGTAALTLNQALVTVNGNLTLSNGTFALGANSLSLSGNFIANSALTTAAGSTFTFTGASATLSGSTAPSFRDIVVNGSLSSSVNYNVAGNYTIGIGADVSASSGTVTFNGTTAIANGGTINLNAVTVAANSSLTAPSNEMGIAGNFIITNGTSTFNNNGGTIIFNGATVLSGTATKTFNNITVSNGSTLSGAVSWGFNGQVLNDGTISFTAGTCTINGAAELDGTGSTSFFDLTINAANSLTTANSITIVDDLTVNGTLTATSGTFTFSTATCSIVGTGTKNFFSISVPASGTLTYAVIVNIAGDLMVDGTLAEGSGTTIFNGSGTSAIQGSGTISFNFLTINLGVDVEAGVAFSLDDDLTVNGTFSSTDEITITGPVIILGSGTSTFTDINIVAGNTLTPNMNISISGGLIVDGTLAAGNSTTTFDGSTTISGSGTVNFNFLVITDELTSSSGVISVVRDFTNNGTFNHNGGTVSFSTTGTVQQQILGSNSIEFNNLTANNVGVAVDLVNNITAPATVSIYGTLTLGETATVFDADGAGTSELILVSTNDDPTSDARVAALPAASSNITGNITVQRFVSDESTGRFYRYISSPVVGATVSQLKAAIPVTGVFADPSDDFSTPPCTGCIPTNPSLYSYNESTSAYVAFPGSGINSSSAPFVSGRGYSAFFRHQGSGGVGSVVINFRGTNPPQTGVTLPVSSSASGFSLVGNPYPSAIVWNNGAGWTKSNIADGIVVRDNATGVHQAYSAVTGTGIIAAGQAFWVQSSAGGASLSINEGAKSSSSTSFYKLDQPILDEVNLLLTKTSTGTTDMTTISRKQGSVAGLDAFDVVKFDNSMDNGSTVIQVHDLAFMSGSTMLLVSAVPEVSCGGTYNLRIRDVLNSGEATASYTMDIQLGGSFAALDWILMDSETGGEHHLSDGPYQFVVNSGDASVSSFASGTRFLTNRFSIKAISQPIDASLAISASQTVCDGSEGLLSIADSQLGMTYGVEVNGQLYQAVKQGNGNDLNIFIPSEYLQSGSNAIRVHVSAGCDSQFLVQSASIEKSGIYDVVNTAGGLLCKPGSAVVSAEASAPGAILKWYDQLNSTAPIGTGEVFNTPELFATKTYYVAASNALGCEGMRIPVEVVISDLSSLIEVSKSSEKVCSGQSLTLTASSTLEDGEYKWYEGLTSENPIFEGASFATGALSKSTSFFVAFHSNSGCESSRIEIEAVVDSFNPAMNITLSQPEVCIGSTHSILASGAPLGSSYQWFDTETGTNPIHVGNIFVTKALSETTTYYLRSVNSAGCISSELYEVIAPVSQSPETIFAFQASEVCPDADVSLNLVPGDVSNVTYKWYESELSTVSIFEGKTLNTQLGSSTTYFVSAVNAYGCESGERKAINAPVIELNDPIIENPEPGVLSVNNIAIGEWQWYYNDEAMSGETGKSIVADNVGKYAFEVTYKGCKTWTSTFAGPHVVTGITERSVTYHVFPNPATEKLLIEIVEIEPVTATLYDAKGALVGEIGLTHESDRWKGEYDVNAVTSGNYFLRLTTGKKSITHQVIIRK